MKICLIWLPNGFSNDVSKIYLQLGVEVPVHQNLQHLGLDDKNMDRKLSSVNIELMFMEH